MPVTHTNRKGDLYYLHVGKTRTGKPRYTFSRKDSGVLVETIPDGYEIYENPHAQVFLRKRLRSRIRDDEAAACHAGLARWSRLPPYAWRLEHRKDHLEVLTLNEGFAALASRLGGAGLKARPEDLAQKYGTYGAMLQFVLVDGAERTFVTERYCFLGGVDGWILIGGPDTLDALVEMFAPHLGQESFFEIH